MRVVALLVFIPLQLAFVPLAIFGMLLQLYPQMVVSKRLGVSQTGIEVLGGRWAMHIFEGDHEARLQHFVESEGLTVESATFMGTKSKHGPFMVVTDLRT